MKPFRTHVALAVDGGGIRGTMVAKALAVVEAELGKPCSDLFHLSAGTSTGSIISAAIGASIPAERVHELYVRLGGTIFGRSWRTIWPLATFKYPNEPLIAALRDTLGELRMGDLAPFNVVITIRDVKDNRTLFVKTGKDEYKEMKLWYAALCSSSVPTYFPVVDDRYVDGGVGAYTNPVYLAAWEAAYRLGWDQKETTLISIGTGRVPAVPESARPGHMNPLQWIRPLVDTFLADSSDQQVRLVRQFFPELDFRRFQVDLHPPIEMDDPKGIPALTQWGETLGQMILNDQMDADAMQLPTWLTVPIP